MGFKVYPEQDTAQASIDTYLISGGLSQADLLDLNINRVETSTFRIDGVDLAYAGDTDIPVPPNVDDYKVYLFNNGGVGGLGIAQEAPGGSIIIASFDSDDVGITEYRLSGNFAINTEVNKLLEHANHIVEGDFTKVINPDETVTVTWEDPIRIYLLSQAAGAGIYNTLPAGSVTLAKGNVAYVEVDRATNAVRSLKTGFKSSVDLKSDDQYIFFYSSEGVFTTSISPLRRVEHLEEIKHEVEVFESSSSMSGEITIFLQSELVEGRFAGGGNATLTTLDTAGRPTGITPKTEDGSDVNVILLPDGNYTISGTPSEFPVGVVYTLEISKKHLENIPKDKLYKVFNVSADVSYTATEPTVIDVGGISAGTTFTNLTYEDLIEGLFYPELFPNLTNPSFTFTSNQTGLREIGSEVNISFNFTFNRGSINPQYESDSPHRSGLPNTYNLSGVGVTGQNSSALSYSESLSDFEVPLGNTTWQGSVSYDAGVQPKGSKGTDFNSPLSAGTTNTISRTVTGVYPYFGTTANLTTSTKQSLQNHGSTITIDLVEEDGVNKQFIEIPQAWGVVSSVSQLNTLSGNYDSISLSSFTQTSITKEINGYTVDYYLYTHNGSTIGGRRLRFFF